ncbi:unnamed protein product, partial [Brenthis ino]
MCLALPLRQDEHKLGERFDYYDLELICYSWIQLRKESYNRNSKFHIHTTEAELDAQKPVIFRTAFNQLSYYAVQYYILMILPKIKDPIAANVFTVAMQHDISVRKTFAKRASAAKVKVLLRASRLPERELSTRRLRGCVYTSFWPLTRAQL